jgi:Reverse transcriptase (RNA-dependent DNA polymerase)
VGEARYGREGRPHEEPVTTRDGGVRMMARLPNAHAHAYAAAVASLSRRIERSLSPAAMANRVRGRGAGPPSVELEGWRSARHRFSSAATAAAARAPAVALGDAADCYGSVDIRILERRLRTLGARAAELRPLLAILERFHEHGLRGLPVGPAASAILANALLGHVDESLARRGGGARVRHLRWVDDIIVFAPDDRSARDALARFEDALGEVGLGIAPSKTGLAASRPPAESLRLERLSGSDALL